MRPASGSVASVGASLLFALMFYASSLFSTDAIVLTAWRIAFGSLACIALLAVPANRFGLSQYLRRLSTDWRLWIMAPVLSALLALQMWLFAWAPGNGYALEASLGFLLLPLVLVFGARVLLDERPTPVQAVACSIAFVAVAVTWTLGGELSWVVVAIGFGFPIYFLARRRLGLDGLPGFGAEMLLATPFALGVLIATSTKSEHEHSTLPADIAYGIAGGVALLLFVLAASWLPFPVFGVLTYLEPVLLLFVAVLIGTSLSASDLFMGLMLLAAIALVCFESLVQRARLGRSR